MMRGRFRTPNNEGGPLGLLLGAFALALALFFLFRFGGVVRDLFYSLSAPSNISAEYRMLSREALVARLKDADRELARLRYANILNDLLADENQKLRAAAHAADAVHGVSARVLARPPRTAYDSLVIDLGSKEGVAPGALVTAGPIAIGRVSSVSSKASVVALFSNPGAEQDVLVGAPQSVAIARGLGGGAFELTVPQELGVLVGDTVRFPASASLALGMVTEISSKPTDTSKVVRFSAPVSAATLDFVEVAVEAP